jgi:transposase
MKAAIDKTNFPPQALELFDRLEAENLSLESEVQSLESENTKLSHELLYCRRLFYGRRPEKRMPSQPDGQLFIPFGEETVKEETADIKPVIEEIQVASHKRRTKQKENRKKAIRREIPAEIERRVRVIEPAGINLETMVKIGEDNREILQYIPGKFYVDRIVRPVYREKEQPKDAVSTPVYRAEAVESFIPESFAGNTLLTQLITGKHIDHLPVCRQMEIFKRQGIKLSASTVSGRMREVASQLSPLYEKLVADTLSSDYIQMDESTLPITDR